MIKNFKYGARPPSENAQLVSDQMYLAHRYYNALTEIERQRRVAVRWILSEDNAEMKKRQLAAIKDVVNGRIRKARSECGLYWGTYLLVEAAAQDSAKKTSMAKDPRFVGWNTRSRWRVGVQLQGGLSVAAAFSGIDTRLRIEPIPDIGRKQPGSRRYGQQHLVHLRIGSEGRAPIWTVVRATLHRPLPPDGVIKWAWLQRDRIGGDYRWSVYFTVATEMHWTRADGWTTRTRSRPKKVVAINLGWRMRPDGMRVAYWVDDTGAHGELVLPEEWFLSVEHYRHLQSVRKRLFNDFRSQLTELLSGHELPEWMQEETAHLHQWKSPNRLGRLVRRWGRERFEGDEAIFATGDDCPRDANGALDCAAHAQCWERKDSHLQAWIAHGTNKTLERRNEQYKRWARIFADSYETIIIDDFDIRGVVGRAALDESASDAEKVVADNVSSRRHSAAPSKLRDAILNASGKRGMKHDCKCKTMRCWSCGFTEPWQKDHLVPPIDHRCAECGITWDQDYNHAVQHRREWESSGPVLPETPEALAGGMSAKQQAFRDAKKRKRKKKRQEKKETANLSKSALKAVEISKDREPAGETLAQEDLF